MSEEWRLQACVLVSEKEKGVGAWTVECVGVLGGKGFDKWREGRVGDLAVGDKMCDVGLLVFGWVPFVPSQGEHFRYWV